MPIENFMQRAEHYIHSKIEPALELVLHFLILALIVALLVGIVVELVNLFGLFTHAWNMQEFIGKILFIFILVELFSILHSYYENHVIKVERVIEVGIISVVRELLFKMFEIDVAALYAVSVLLIALGILFFTERWFTARNNGS